MRIVGIRFRGQAGCIIAILSLLLGTSCFGKKEEAPVLPPETFPLSQPHIGFGVINVSYPGVSTVPGEGGASLGYLRRGTVVRILERRQIKTGGNTESWLLVEEAYKGWLKETLVEVYENESKARTASEAMSR
jgi:hypothetical protein